MACRTLRLLPTPRKWQLFSIQSFCNLFVICPDSACTGSFVTLYSLYLLLQEMCVPAQAPQQRAPGAGSQPVSSWPPRTQQKGWGWGLRNGIYFFGAKNKKAYSVSLEAQTIMNPSVIMETWVRSPGWENPLEEEMAAHSVFFPGKCLWTEEPGGLYSPWGREESDMTERLNTN